MKGEKKGRRTLSFHRLHVLSAMGALRFFVILRPAIRQAVRISKTATKPFWRYVRTKALQGKRNICAGKGLACSHRASRFVALVEIHSTRLLASLGMIQYGGLFAMSAQTCRDRRPRRSSYTTNIKFVAMSAQTKPSPAVRTVVALRQRRACYASIAGTTKWWMRCIPDQHPLYCYVHSNL